LRRGSSVGTALPHYHLRLQLQGRGTVEPLSEPEEPEEKQTKKGKYRSKIIIRRRNEYVSCELRGFRLFIGERYRRLYRRIIEY